MIYTVTLNPSLDYIVEVDQVTLGELNRTKNESKFPGGKGINVSQVLKRLDVDSYALGFLGGFTGDYIEGFLTSQGIQTDFVKVNEDTRINVKLKSDKETEINAKGPNITEENFESLKGKIRELTSEDTLVLAGSIPSTMPESTYKELVKLCNANGTKFVVDAEGELLKKVLPLHPFLIKPNHHELGDLFNTVINSCEEVIPFGRELVKQGAQNVIVSLAEKGAVLINKDIALIATSPKGDVKSSVGAGDSMVAGFIAAYEKTKSLEEAFRFSVAAGSATAFSIGLCTREKMEDLLPQVKIEKTNQRGE
ncbi:1-phosphofructokinase [Bacillus sp. EB106-08-02-XG196]|jgi:1-phosphofructokinase|uniref:1-phosphofructokinase n=1 Tax=Bacillus sp. EB106-08-02-XG196 TaxID=2737049 RepID=UPI0015C43CA9|nr:1-phosphofructokinase [Bacillus sp. EB106-08-02-XG196]NWQ43197.1 1-phosphofructokinase [Bacillus sp. EB106-08-02-XG196]